MQTQVQVRTKKLSVEEAASYLVSPHTIRAWVREKRLPFYRLGRRILFDEVDITTLWADSRVEPIER